jgi:hypothetical protein
VQIQSQFDHFRLGFLLTVYSLVVDILKHTADSVAAGVSLHLSSQMRPPPKGNLRRFVPYQLTFLARVLKRAPSAFVTAI